MVAVTAREMCAATGGTLYGDGNITVTEVSTDSRSIMSGVWFIPIKGERFDGHDYIDMALEKGAAGCFCARLPEKIREDKAYILVEDTKRAMKDLASWYRDKFTLPIVQITGSVGKTTTKEMIASVLKEGRSTHKTKGNLNGDIGAPLMMLGILPEHEAAVIETGMDNFGQIRYLGEMIRPDFAVISNIGEAHMEYLGSREGILKAKSEIFENLKPGGVAVLNGDDVLLNTLDLPFETLRCGMGENCNVRVENVEDLGVAGVKCTVRTPKAVYRMEIPAPGVHMVYSAAMAAAIAEKLGLSVEQIERGVRSFEQTGERMRVERLSGGRIMLNDSYNANPQSMRAAAAVLGNAQDRRRVAVVGDMKELGANSRLFHHAVGGYFAAAGIERLIAIGDLALYMAEGAREAGLENASYYGTLEEAQDALRRELRPGVTILVKASRSMQFERIVDFLQENLSN